jgi:hypothetical protein
MSAKETRRVKVFHALAPLGIASALLLGAVTPSSASDSGSDGPMGGFCGYQPANSENRIEVDAPDHSVANMRTGPSTFCGLTGKLEMADDARYYCFTEGLDSDGWGWTYLQNQSNSVTGWVRNDLLNLEDDGITRGSTHHCFL